MANGKMTVRLSRKRAIKIAVILFESLALSAVMNHYGVPLGWMMLAMAFFGMMMGYLAA